MEAELSAVDYTSYTRNSVELGNWPDQVALSGSTSVTTREWLDLKQVAAGWHFTGASLFCYSLNIVDKCDLRCTCYYIAYQPAKRSEMSH